jgi:hypothetical protein
MAGKYLLSAASVALLITASSAQAAEAGNTEADGFAGFVEVGGNVAIWDFGIFVGSWGSDYNPWSGFSGGSLLSLQINSSVSAQIDVRHWSVGDSYDSGYWTLLSNLIAAHLNWSPTNYSIGAFAGALTTNSYYESGTDLNLIAGLEGGIHVLDDVTIDAQIGFFGQIRGYYDHGIIAFGQISTQYFHGDNFRLEANVGMIAGQVGDTLGEDALTITWGVEGEHQFSDNLFSLFVRYSGYTDVAYFETTGHMITGGVRFSLDDNLSLRQQHSHGVSHQIMDLSAYNWMRYQFDD